MHSPYRVGRAPKFAAAALRADRSTWIRWLLAAACLGSLAASCAGDSFSSLGGEGGAAEGGATGEAGEPEQGGAPASGGRVSGGTGGTTNASGGASGMGQGGNDEGGSPPEFGGGRASGGAVDGGTIGTTGGTFGKGGGTTTGGATTGGAQSGGVIGDPGGGSPGGGSPGGDTCEQPVVPGPCDGSIPRYAFLPELGICQMFIYGGCDGNQNNFETIEDCYAACGGKGEIDPTSCEESSDCVLLDQHCCTACEPVSVNDFVSVTNPGASALIERRNCGEVACAPCPGPEGRPERPWIGVKCEDGQCMAFDARQTELTECEQDEDCRLRFGVGCCEGCEGVPDFVVAVSTDAEFGEPYCTGDVACAACTPPPPEELMAVCGQDQRCAVTLAVTPVID